MLNSFYGIPGAIFGPTQAFKAAEQLIHMGRCIEFNCPDAKQVDVLLDGRSMLSILFWVSLSYLVETALRIWATETRQPSAGDNPELEKGIRHQV